MAISYKHFYESFGFFKFPFNTFTTENELDIANEIFIAQGEYDPIIDAFKDGKTIILRGERGSGKTAILEDFSRLSSSHGNFVTIIQDYNKVNSNPSLSEIYRLLITHVLIDLFAYLKQHPTKTFKLNKEDKLLLSYLLAEFLPSFSQNSLKEKISKIQTSVFKRTFIKIYNILRGPLNFTGTVGKNILYEYFLKHYSFLPQIKDDRQIQEFFPELKLNVETDFFSQDVSYKLLNQIGDVIKKLGFSKPTIFLDRFDEDARFENDAEKISDFLAPYLTDTNLLSMANFQLVFFVWSTPFRFIEDRVRTQKYYCPVLKWSQEDLKKLLNRRIKYYSENKLADYQLLFEPGSEKDIEEIFDLANGNPRDLIHLFEALFSEQYSEDSSSKYIKRDTIGKALDRFVINFNYYEYYPKKSNARANSMDIYSYASHLLKLENEIFTKNQLSERAGTGSSTNNYVSNMEKIGLVENIKQEKGNAIYKIKDSKIVYSLLNNLDLRKK